jgi:uncharacterized protein YaiI (UPF0178 family)
MVIARRGTIYREIVVGEMLEKKKTSATRQNSFEKYKKNNCLGKT